MKSIVSLILLALIVGCSAKKTDKELFNEAQKNLKEDKMVGCSENPLCRGT